MANSEKPQVATDDIESLIALFNQSGWDEMHLEAAGFELFLSNDPAALGPRSTSPAGARAASAADTAPALSTGAATLTRDGDHIPTGLVAIRAPILGTFFRAPKPGAPNYVDVGQQVETTTEVCLIEVMKLFTPVPSGVRGIVREIRAGDGQMVEFDQPLILIDPN